MTRWSAITRTRARRSALAYGSRSTTGAEHNLNRLVHHERGRYPRFSAIEHILPRLALTGPQRALTACRSCPMLALTARGLLRAIRPHRRATPPTDAGRRRGTPETCGQPGHHVPRPSRSQRRSRPHHRARITTTGVKSRASAFYGMPYFASSANRRLPSCWRSATARLSLRSPLSSRASAPLSWLIATPEARFAFNPAT